MPTSASYSTSAGSSRQSAAAARPALRHNTLERGVQLAGSNALPEVERSPSGLMLRQVTSILQQHPCSSLEDVATDDCSDEFSRWMRTHERLGGAIRPPPFRWRPETLGPEGITCKVKDCSTWYHMCDTVWLYSTYFRPFHHAVLLIHLAQLGPGPTPSPVLSSNSSSPVEPPGSPYAVYEELLQQLLQLCSSSIAQFSARQVANLLWACATLSSNYKGGHPMCLQLFDLLLPASQRLMAASNAVELSCSVWAVARRSQPPSPAWLASFLPAFQAAMQQGDARPRELSTCCWALCELGVTPDASWQACFLAQVQSQLYRCSPRDAAQILVSCARWKVDMEAAVPKLLPSLRDQLLDGLVAELEAQGVCLPVTPEPVQPSLGLRFKSSRQQSSVGVGEAAAGMSGGLEGRKQQSRQAGREAGSAGLRERVGMTGTSETLVPAGGVKGVRAAAAAAAGVQGPGTLTVVEVQAGRRLPAPGALPSLPPLGLPPGQTLPAPSPPALPLPPVDNLTAPSASLPPLVTHRTPSQVTLPILPLPMPHIATQGPPHISAQGPPHTSAQGPPPSPALAAPPTDPGGGLPQTLSLALWSLAVMQAAPPTLWMKRAFSVLEARLTSFSPQALATVVWATVSLGQPLPPRLVHIVYASTVHQRVHHHLPDFLVPPHPQHLASFEPQELATLVWSLSVAAASQSTGTGSLSLAPPTAWCEAVQEAVLHKLSDYNEHSLSLVLVALARFKACPPAAWGSAVAAHMHASMPHMGMQALANSLWALGRMKSGANREGLQQMLTRLQAQLVSMTGEVVAAQGLQQQVAARGGAAGPYLHPSESAGLSTAAQDQPLTKQLAAVGAAATATAASGAPGSRSGGAAGVAAVWQGGAGNKAAAKVEVGAATAAAVAVAAGGRGPQTSSSGAPRLSHLQVSSILYALALLRLQPSPTLLHQLLAAAHAHYDAVTLAASAGQEHSGGSQGSRGRGSSSSSSSSNSSSTTSSSKSTSGSSNSTTGNLSSGSTHRHDFTHSTGLAPGLGASPAHAPGPGPAPGWPGFGSGVRSRDLANTMLALARLGVKPSPAWLAAFWRAVQARLHTFNGRDISQVVYALARLNTTPPTTSPTAHANQAATSPLAAHKGAAAFSLQAEHHQPGSPLLNHLATSPTTQPTLQPLGAGGNHPWLQHLLAEAVLTFSRTSGQDLALLSWGLAQLGVQPGQSVVAQLAATLVARCDAFQPGHCAVVLWALGRLGYRPPPASLLPVEGSLYRRMSSLTAREAAALSWALRSLQYTPDAALLEQLVGHCQAVAPTFTAKEWAVVLGGLADRVQGDPERSTYIEDLLLSPELRQQLPLLQPKDMAMIAHAAGCVLGAASQRMQRLLLRTAQPILPAFSHSELLALITGCVRAGKAPDKAFLQAWMDETADRMHNSLTAHSAEEGGHRPLLVGPAPSQPQASQRHAHSAPVRPEPASSQPAQSTSTVPDLLQATTTPACLATAHPPAPPHSLHHSSAVADLQVLKALEPPTPGQKAPPPFATIPPAHPPAQPRPGTAPGQTSQANPPLLLPNPPPCSTHPSCTKPTPTSEVTVSGVSKSMQDLPATCHPATTVLPPPPPPSTPTRTHLPQPLPLPPALLPPPPDVKLVRSHRRSPGPWPRTSQPAPVPAPTAKPPALHTHPLPTQQPALLPSHSPPHDIGSATTTLPHARPSQVISLLPRTAEAASDSSESSSSSRLHRADSGSPAQGPGSSPCKASNRPDCSSSIRGDSVPGESRIQHTSSRASNGGQASDSASSSSSSSTGSGGSGSSSGAGSGGGTGSCTAPPPSGSLLVAWAWALARLRVHPSPQWLDLFLRCCTRHMGPALERPDLMLTYEGQGQWGEQGVGRGQRQGKGEHAQDREGRGQEMSGTYQQPRLWDKAPQGQRQGQGQGTHGQGQGLQGQRQGQGQSTQADMTGHKAVGEQGAQALTPKEFLLAVWALGTWAAPVDQKAFAHILDMAEYYRPQYDERCRTTVRYGLAALERHHVRGR